MRKSHSLLWQGVLLVSAVALVGWLGANAREHLDQRGMSLDFGFLGQSAGFTIPFNLISFVSTDTYLRALGVAFLNTLLVSALGIVTASVLGLALGIMRLSVNWLARTISGVIIEIVRNTPQLLQIIFWYVGVLQFLPQLRQSLSVGGTIFLNVRGLFVPTPILGPNSGWILAACLISLVLLCGAWLRGWRVGRWPWIVPAAAFAAFAWSIESWSVPKLQGFNFTGGTILPPELVALWAGLSLYSSAFIAEIVRASILGVPKGQTEAAQSLGLRTGAILRLVVLPQALRVMMPQITSQYLNLIKTSSLGAAIAYPEIVQTFAGTVLNQSGRAIEVMVIVMLVFLTINLLASAALERVNRGVALKER